MHTLDLGGAWASASSVASSSKRPELSPPGFALETRDVLELESALAAAPDVMYA